MNPLAVHCRNVCKTFRTQEIETFAVRQADLDIPQGELVMIVGPSGCGKTTLISILAGILSADSGECLVLGKNYKNLSSKELLNFRARSIGFIFQSFNLIPTLNVRENVSIPLIIQGVERYQAEAQAQEILERVGLGNRGENSPNQLSGGQQQRVAIARALVHKPAIVICDEPTSALDHATGESILQLMKSMNKTDHTTFIIVTHDARIYSYADRIAHMDDGHITKVTTHEHHL
jgi:putative ABC transport system ATP-binding protein